MGLAGEASSTEGQAGSVHSGSMATEPKAQQPMAEHQKSEQAETEEPRTDQPKADQPRRPDHVEESNRGLRSAVTQPSKLIRIAAMTRAMLSEVREAELDQAGRDRLIEIHGRTLREMKEVLSEDLQEELVDMFLPLSGEPSDAELRVAQAQLVGWLEGLFAGIQASLVSKQLVAQHQLAEMRRPQLEKGEEEEEQTEYPGGVYL